MEKKDIKIEIRKDLKKKIDDNELGFGKTFTDHMFIMDWNFEKGWHSPRIVPYQNLSIDPATSILHYGQSVFEGLKAYNSSGNILLFRPKENFKRLNISAERMTLPKIDVDFALEALKTLLEVDKEWIPQKEGTSLYIRPLLFATETYLGLAKIKTAKFIIILSPSSLYFENGLEPVKILVEDEYVRAVKGGVGFAKAAGNYAASMKGQEKAMSLGCSQSLWLDAKENKYIEEVGTMNIFFKINDEYITPELSGSILDGITRKSVIEILRNEGKKVTERKISIDEIIEAVKNKTLKECFGTGTAAVISPIGSLLKDNYELVINDFKVGKNTKQLYNLLTGIQIGKLEDKFNWTIKI